MIFPLSHEESTVGRWPWVTIAIIVLNVAVFAGTHGRMQVESERAQQTASLALEYYVQHSYLVAPADLRALAPNGTATSVAQSTTQEDFARIQREVLGRGSSEAEASSAREQRIQAEQRTLDHLVVQMRTAEQDRLVVRYGNVPADYSLTGLVTSQSLHAGWLHLFTNLWFLWLVGCNVEDRWGRVAFSTFYLSAGVAAALIHNLVNWGSTVPVIGASGAMAGAMGAFLMRFARTRIRFAYWVSLRPGTFRAPAYLMLPLWAGKELLEWGALGQNAAVAHWAHLGGFAYGVVFALVVAASGLERRLDWKLERRDTVSEQDPALGAASSLVDQGRTAEALQALDRLRTEKPHDIKVRLELLRAAHAAGDTGRETQGHVELIGLYLRQGAEDTAVELYQELVQAGTETALPLDVRFRIARRLERQGNSARAEQQYAKIHSGSLEDESAFQALLAHAALCVREGRKASALELCRTAKEAVRSHLLLETTLQQAIRAAQNLPDETGASRGQDSPRVNAHDEGAPEIEAVESPALVLMVPSDPVPGPPQTSILPSWPARDRRKRTPNVASARAPEPAVTLERGPAATELVTWRPAATSAPATQGDGTTAPDTTPHARTSARPSNAGRYSLRPGSIREVDIVTTPSNGPAAPASPHPAHRAGRGSGSPLVSAGHYSMSVPSIESVQRTPSAPAGSRSPSGPTKSTGALEEGDSGRPRPDAPRGEHRDPKRDPRRS